MARKPIQTSVEFEPGHLLRDTGDADVHDVDAISLRVVAIVSFSSGEK